MSPCSCLHRSAAVTVPKPLSEKTLTNKWFRLYLEKPLYYARAPWSIVVLPVLSQWGPCCPDFPGWRLLSENFPDAWKMFCGAVCAPPLKSCRWCCYHRMVFWTCNKNGWLKGVSCVVLLCHRKIFVRPEVLLVWGFFPPLPFFFFFFLNSIKIEGF